MDDLINDYLELNYTQELCYEMQRAIQLFDHFNYKVIFEKITNLIMDVHNQDKTEVNDQICAEIRIGQNHIFDAHGLKINPDSSIRDRNELLVALALLMRQEDYEPILSVLYSQEDDMEIFVSIITDICMLDDINLYDMVEELDEQFLKTLKVYAEGKTYKEDQDDLGRVRTSIQDNIRIFKELYGDSPVGVQLVKSGILIGARFNTYYPYIKDHLIDENSIEQTAKNFLSTLIISSNGNNAPVITFKKFVDKFTDNLDLIRRLEPVLVKLLGEMENYKRAKHEETRVPEISGQSKQISQ